VAEFVPSTWHGKKVVVLFGQEGGGSSFVARLVNDSAGGIHIEITEDQAVRKLFVPWSAVRYVELLEEAAESPGLRPRPS
jgi:predicted kinase